MSPPFAMIRTLLISMAGGVAGLVLGVAVSAIVVLWSIDQALRGI